MEPLSRTTTSDQPSSTRLRRVAVALGGVLAGGFGLGLAELIAGTSPRFRSPVLDVGDRVIDRVPAALKDVAIALFGTNDKIALLVPGRADGQRHRAHHRRRASSELTPPQFGRPQPGPIGTRLFRVHTRCPHGV